jgi:WhiB family redox-sensing transcriptional regulator
MDEAWDKKAKCTDNPEVMFPNLTLKHQVDRAKAVCVGCPVKAECLADTPEWDEWSVRGGTTPRERAKHQAGAA